MDDKIGVGSTKYKFNEINKLFQYVFLGVILGHVSFFMKKKAMLCSIATAIVVNI
jgi:hypothetical protein